ncbi:MAG: terpene cyclase/mutase family protein [Verrucomicrobiae bacterium]|nr:terpene cyclase/mutase family protein [Verrucomicrobiae bacterium]
MREREAAVGISVNRALDRLAETQETDGSWWGDYGGPMFLLPMYVVLCHLSAWEISEERRQAMRRELFSAQRADGGIGLHAEGDSMLLTSVLAYVALRLLGTEPDNPELIRMRRWIAAHGSPLGAAPWGKWILCLLGLYPYCGLTPILPELWLLPKWLPIHPGRLWCHCRMVYLPASYLYATRAQQAPNDLIQALREELYDQPWDEIDFAAHRNQIAPSDKLIPTRLPGRLANRALAILESLIPHRLRQRALREVLRQINFEDSVTNHLAIGPVNRVLNSLCHHFREPGGEPFQASMVALDAYLWDTDDGRCRMQGYNNSKLWDTAFAIQSAMAAGASRSHPEMLHRAHGYLRDHQILDDVPAAAEHYRSPSKGGWPFSNRDHGWPISDCTAEGFKSSLLLGDWKPETAIPEERLRESIPLMLHWQNPDGGWPTYEKQRGGSWLESLNPSGVFDRIMVDYSYAECTSTVLDALVRAQKRFPDCHSAEVALAIDRGGAWLRSQQRDDGSWEGSWGVCFTYGTWFGVSGLMALGAGSDDPALIRASEFLLSHQHDDGGWGEAISSCHQRKWVDVPEGHVVQTAWALLSLIRSGNRDHEAQARAVDFLSKRQSPDGGWPHEGMVGIFNRTCAINYDWYRLYFPLWALAEWHDQQTEKSSIRTSG